jgi:uncharacterized protein
MRFQWDEKKASGNEAKHRVTFLNATLVFRDAFAIEHLDQRMDYGEDRFIITGISRGQLLTVVYTEREDAIRIISARKACNHEREDYYRRNGR